MLSVVKCCVPNNRKGDANEKENKSCDQDIVATMLFGLGKLAGAVISISLVPRSAHRDKGEHCISKDKSDTDECPLAADVHHACKKRHQNTCDEESIG